MLLVILSIISQMVIFMRIEISSFWVGFVLDIVDTTMNDGLANRLKSLPLPGMP